MKLVVAIVKPFKLDEIRFALSAEGIQGMTITEVNGFGRQKGHTELYRGSEYVVEFVPKIKIEIAIQDEQLDRTVDAILSSAKTASLGDGKVFVYELMDVVRIRTQETGIDAI